MTLEAELKALAEIASGFPCCPFVELTIEQRS
jgi:hypothetical protein